MRWRATRRAAASICCWRLKVSSKAARISSAATGRSSSSSPASLPGDELDDLPVAAEEIRADLLDTFDRQQQIGAAARLVARHLILGHSPEALIATLAQALLREDAGFHAYQMLEAGVRQFREWGNGDQGRHILIAVARYLAAHWPTQRALLQTADIARRLMRGGELHREAQAVE